jgi:hypothetical protein
MGENMSIERNNEGGGIPLDPQIRDYKEQITRLQSDQSMFAVERSTTDTAGKPIRELDWRIGEVSDATVKVLARRPEGVLSKYVPFQMFAAWQANWANDTLGEAATYAGTRQMIVDRWAIATSPTIAAIIENYTFNSPQLPGTK